MGWGPVGSFNQQMILPLLVVTGRVFDGRVGTGNPEQLALRGVKSSFTYTLFNYSCLALSCFLPRISFVLRARATNLQSTGRLPSRPPLLMLNGPER